ncbi:hypothetical protein PPSIR1_34912 [Plesiocystis pacifica SIR-1]|uniref:YbjN domain-containing protein n=1 Tax=Plesiocystis pacifica SIR-1 TaxID=391625 RepID=A6G3P0_9BACT|nr:hypothetical protein [Plesiocystis pacifica]EDM79427.1 hypothetical protein PPSIR1_34912 [Plesiocystis pacifica SIR-1]
MLLEALAELIARTCDDFQRSETHWQFVHGGIPMACLFDREHDRMRFVAPITELENLDEATKDAVLEANFHSALDARYGSSNGLLFAAFVHPLSSLDLDLAHSALSQVASLVHTFGTYYSSGHLEFLVPGHEVEELEDDEDEEDDEPLLN